MNYTAVVFKICHSEHNGATFTPTFEHLWVVCSLSVPTGTEAFPCRCSLLPTSSRRHSEKKKFHLQTKYLHHLLKKDGNKQHGPPCWVDKYKVAQIHSRGLRPTQRWGGGEVGKWVSLGKFLQMETGFMRFSTRQVHINPPFFQAACFAITLRGRPWDVRRVRHA